MQELPEFEIYFERDERGDQLRDVVWVYFIESMGQKFEVSIQNPQAVPDIDGTDLDYDWLKINGQDENDFEDSPDPYNPDLWKGDLAESILQDLHDASLPWPKSRM